MPRRFPRPWRVESLAACFKIVDATGFAVAYVYFDARPAGGYQSHLMSRNEAEIIALNIARIGAEPDRYRHTDIETEKSPDPAEAESGQ